MFLQSGPLGTIGLITDPPEHTLPIGAWRYVRNMRFTDGYVERVREPALIANTAPVPGHDPIWIEQWIDSGGAQIVYGSSTKLFKFNTGSEMWEDVSKGGGTYGPSAYWQSFAWGTSVVFNNGIDPPQILYEGQATFVDLPNWGLISSDPNNPTQDVDTQARCACIRPYRNFMVAINITEQYQNADYPNRVWWSAPAQFNDDPDPTKNPSWDYADPGTLSGFINVATEDGPLIDQLQLGPTNVIYTAQSATLMQFTGDSTTVFSFNKEIDYGIANIHAVASYQNFHLGVGLDTVFVHDGSTVNQLLDGRAQRGFYDLNPIAGTFQVEHYLVEKEIHILTETTRSDLWGQNRKYIFVYNYKSNTFSVLDAFTDIGAQRKYIAAMSYATRSADNTLWQDLDTTTWGDLSINGTRWRDFFGSPESRRMLWINQAGLQTTEQDSALNPSKEYVLSRQHIDLSERDQSMTANLYKHMRQIYPHIDSDKNTTGNGVTRITVSWSDTLFSDAATSQPVDYDPNVNLKADYRTTGRYLGLEMRVLTGGTWRFTSMDFDVEVQYAR